MNISAKFGSIYYFKTDKKQKDILTESITTQQYELRQLALDADGMLNRGPNNMFEGHAHVFKYGNDVVAITGKEWTTITNAAKPDFGTSDGPATTIEHEGIADEFLTYLTEQNKKITDFDSIWATFTKTDNPARPWEVHQNIKTKSDQTLNINQNPQPKGKK